MRVAVYFNIRRRVFSVKALDGPSRGRVIGHHTYVPLLDVCFRVSQAGRARVLETGQKNVHAFVVGTMSDPQSDEWRLRRFRYEMQVVGPKRYAVYYNPKRDAEFMTKDGPIRAANVVELSVDQGVPSIQAIVEEN